MINHSIFEDFKIEWKKYIIKTKNVLTVETPSDNFLYWFIGFAEGHNVFNYCKKKDPEFRLVVLKSKFEKVLKIISNELRLGTVSESKLFGNTKKWLSLNIAKKEELYLLVMLFDGHVVTHEQRKLFLVFREQVKKLYFVFDWNLNEINNSPRPTKYDTWLLGFIEVKGIFTCSVLFHSLGFKTRFMICTPIIDDIIVFESCFEIFGCGRLQHWNSKKSYCFVISGVKKIKNIHYYFDNFINEFTHSTSLLVNSS